MAQSVRTTSASKPALMSVARGSFWRVGGPVAELPLCQVLSRSGRLRCREDWSANGVVVRFLEEFDQRSVDVVGFSACPAFCN